MRLFVAVSPDEPARAATEAMQAAIRSRARLDARWVAPGALHLTLAFLGNVEIAVIPDLRYALAAALVPVRAFTVGLDRPGAFPTPRRPRVLWLGVGRGAERLTALAETVRTALRPFPVLHDEHAFLPHLTIARIRTPRVAPSLEACLARPLEVAEAQWEVRSVTLFESVLGAGGARHRPEAVLPFGG